MWQPDQRSQDAELEVAKRLSQYYHARKIVHNRDERYDYTFTLPHGTVLLVEIKTDWEAKRWGNCYFEIRNTAKQKPSGILVTAANIWAHYLPHLQTILLIEPTALRWYCAAHLENPRVPLCLSRRHGGDNNSQGYLINTDYLLQRAWIPTCAMTAREE